MRLFLSSDEGAVFSLKTTWLGNLIVADVYYDPHGKTAWNCKLNDQIKCAQKHEICFKKSCVLKEFKSLVYMLLLFYVVTELAQYKL
jgi:hypothetical protein